MKKYSLFFMIASVFFFSACDLDESPVTSIDKKALFGSEKGLTTFSNSFYEMLPGAQAQATSEFLAADYVAPNAVSGFTLKNAIDYNTNYGWDQTSWGYLRNINYFIVNCTDPAVPEIIRNNYIGLARFFRAYFYYDKVRCFGDVPWIDHPLDPGETELLYGTRDSRELVMEKVWEDLMYAADNITLTTDAYQCTLITKWAALAFASRVALFEGTFRKYHGMSLATSANTWLQRAEQTAWEVMQNSGKSLHTNYRALFTSEVPPTSETMLAIAASEALGIRHTVNWAWMVPAMLTAFDLIRPFVCTFLQKDGTPYTDRPGWEYEEWYDEFQNRDGRLNATLRYPGYTREGVISLPMLGYVSRIGYHPIKLAVDETFGDTQSLGLHAVQLLRYGEVLLNYAEAKAELGTLTDSDWAGTIGALRRRAGITGGDLDAKPTVVDNYLKNTYFPDISDPVILEIRRERACELSFEGFRFDDLRRWKRGDLFKMSWTGMYIPAINQPLDLDRNGTDDVIFYTSDEALEEALKDANNAALYRVRVTENPVAGGASVVEVHPADNGTGYHLAWLTISDELKVWGPKQYLYPIPLSALNMNPSLGQNPGWENGARNDGN